MAVSWGNGTALVVLGIVGATLGTVLYYASHLQDEISNDPEWVEGDVVEVDGQELPVLEVKYRYGARTFSLNGVDYYNQWWYRLSNNQWYPEDYLVMQT